MIVHLWSVSYVSAKYNTSFVFFSVQRDGTAILENVSLEGAELPGCQGRLQNPGNIKHSESNYSPALICLPQHFPFSICLPLIMTRADSGHALEAGWFLLQYSAERGDEELQRTAINKFVELPYQRGWDTEHGGLFYFLDVDGHCPTQVNQSSLHMTGVFLQAMDAVGYCLRFVDLLNLLVCLTSWSGV